MVAAWMQSIHLDAALKLTHELREHLVARRTHMSLAEGSAAADLGAPRHPTATMGTGHGTTPEPDAFSQCSDDEIGIIQPLTSTLLAESTLPAAALACSGNANKGSWRWCSAWPVYLLLLGMLHHTCLLLCCGGAPRSAYASHFS